MRHLWQARRSLGLQAVPRRAVLRQTVPAEGLGPRNRTAPAAQRDVLARRERNHASLVFRPFSRTGGDVERSDGERSIELNHDSTNTTMRDCNERTNERMYVRTNELSNTTFPNTHSPRVRVRPRREKNSLQRALPLLKRKCKCGAARSKSVRRPRRGLVTDRRPARRVHAPARPRPRSLAPRRPRARVVRARSLDRASEPRRAPARRPVVVD